jgi:hypothetical protein
MTESAAYRDDLARRVARQRAFHERNEPGDLLVHVWGCREPGLEPALCEKLYEGSVEAVLAPEGVRSLAENYIARLRAERGAVTRFDDDIVPTCLVYWGIGGITGAMTGLDPMHDETTSWLEPNWDWDRIASFRFDPDNRWVRFARDLNQALWDLWEEDFHILPFLHRSPLDAANGIRGTELFVEMRTAPDRVKRLIDQCVDWQLAIEAHLAASVKRPAPAGWGAAVWGSWLPDGAVFVNGDPVGLISPEMAREFEQPYTARLFTSAGGGFFHNHTVGLYQAELVSSTPGTLVQHFVNDPRQPTGAEALLDHPGHREQLLAASLKAPIALGHVLPENIDKVLDIARHGRFILVLGGDADKDDIPAMVRQVRSASNLD